jgi:MATE family multidrug resistance protein
MALCFGLAMWFHKDWKYYIKTFSWRNFSWSEIKQQIKLGFPIGAQTFLETFTFAASFVIIGWISKEALAAHQVANQIADMTFMIALGVGAATTIRVSHQLGEKNIVGVRMASNASIHLVLVINTIGAALMIGLRHYIPMLFTEDQEVIAIASKLIVIAGLFQYADGLQAVGAAMLRGITDVKVPMLIAFVAYILVGLSVGLVCAFPMGMGASGIWIGFIFRLSLAAICFHMRFRRLMSNIDK